MLCRWDWLIYSLIPKIRYTLIGTKMTRTRTISLAFKLIEAAPAKALDACIRSLTDARRELSLISPVQ
jgi:hypothetical protein